jgi:transcriptional regulator with XRE-family HTH domain
MSTPHFGQLVRARRKELGLTQKELGQRMGIKGCAVSYRERVPFRPRIDAARRYAQALRCTLDELGVITNLDSEIARLRGIEWATRRYLVLEACSHTDVDMYAAWYELKAYLGLSDITPEEATEELRKMEDQSCPTS